MWNPFKKDYTETDEFWASLITLAEATRALQVSVRELREEVDYLVDYLDD